MGIKVFSVRYTEDCIRRELFGLPLFKSKKAYYAAPGGMKLDARNFRPLDIDNTALLNELKKAGRFTYIPNPGNLGDMLIGAATLQFFAQNNLPCTLFGEKGCSVAAGDTVVYGGGGAWIPDYEKVTLICSLFRPCCQNYHFAQQFLPMRQVAGGSG